MQLAFSLKRTHSMTGFYITTWNKILGRDIYYEWWMCGIWAMRNNRLDNLWEGTYQIIIIRHDHWYQMISSISIDHVWMLHYLPFVFLKNATLPTILYIFLGWKLRPLYRRDSCSYLIKDYISRFTMTHLQCFLGPKI